LTSDANDFSAEAQGAVERPDPARFYRIRRRVYNGLLVFVVVVGMPIVSVPALRHRLSDRVMALKTALKGEVQPVTLRVGQNPEPFPAEYQRPTTEIPELPQMAQVSKIPPSEGVYTMAPSGKIQRPASEPAPSRPARKPSTTVRAEVPAPLAQPSEETAPPGAADSSADNEPTYQKGTMEQQAYDLLIISNPKIAEMVQGGNPSLRFKSWDAARRADDLFWVRLKFQSEGSEMEYIWLVKPQEKQVSPLNYNARNLP
jgi:hypothetical protein